MPKSQLGITGKVNGIVLNYTSSGSTSEHKVSGYDLLEPDTSDNYRDKIFPVARGAFNHLRPVYDVLVTTTMPAWCFWALKHISVKLLTYEINIQQ